MGFEELGDELAPGTVGDAAFKLGIEQEVDLGAKGDGEVDRLFNRAVDSAGLGHD